MAILYRFGISPNKAFKSLVLQSNGDVISVKPIEDITLLNCSKGDPIVLGCELDNNVYIASCTTLNMDKQQNTLELKIDNYETTSNKRLFVRFPVSLYAEARIGESHKKYLAIVKISVYWNDDSPKMIFRYFRSSSSKYVPQSQYI